MLDEPLELVAGVDVPEVLLDVVDVVVAAVLVDDVLEEDVVAPEAPDQHDCEAAHGVVPAWLYSSIAAASCTDAGAEAAVE